MNTRILCACLIAAFTSALHADELSAILEAVDGDPFVGTNPSACFLI